MVTRALETYVTIIEQYFCAYIRGTNPIRMEVVFPMRYRVSLSRR